MAMAVATPGTDGGSRRKSGRATRAPAVFSQEPYHGSVVDSSKRKRAAAGEDEIDDEQEEQSESEDEEDEGEPDEEELREKRQKRRSKPSVAKPATKRPKTKAGASTTLAIRSANAPTKTVSNAAKKKARSRQSQFDTTGLYADVFGKGLSGEEAAESWHRTMEADHVKGVKDIVNFVLQVIGCESRIDDDDINDVDNVPSRLGDVLTEYDQQKEGDYALSGKQKQYHGMKEVFAEFFRAVPHTMHNSGVMYEATAIYENIAVWIGTMTGASYRSFRHTATTASLSMATGMTEIARIVRDSIAATKQQIDTEKKKKTANKGRLAKLQEEMSREENKLEIVEAQLTDTFNTVYVHRYRDPEEKLREECAAAMGTWILKYRIMFLEGTYLRYLGWVMSDPHALTRLEVIRQLKAIYAVKNNLVALRGFTDRFRARMVEMAQRDADITVRVEVIELLNRLRSVELLNPEDIDTVGQLIFDNEPRVRKAVAQFFVSNIEDLYHAGIEDFDQADLDEALPDADSLENTDEPSKLWIKFKCLAQTLGAQAGRESSHGSKHANLSSNDQVDSRYAIATQAIFSTMPELHHWEALAGYLLHDHSATVGSKKAPSVASAVQEAYRLDDGEEVILLDVLFCSVKLSLQPENFQEQKGRKLNRTKELKNLQETTAHNLSSFIPQLHSKFGSAPRAAKSILRLHQFFDPDLVDDVEDDTGDQSALLDDVSKQFATHSDQQVLAEASRALRAALGHESSKEAAGKKVTELWRNLLTSTMSPLLSGQNISARGTLNRENTRRLADVMGRLASLATVKDCCEIVEGKYTWMAQKSNRTRKESVMEIMLELVKRGVPDEDTPKEAATLEDETSRSAITILSAYHRWKVLDIRKAVISNDKSQLSSGALTTLAVRKNDFVEALTPVILARKPLDPLRVVAIEHLVGLYVVLASIRYITPDKGELDEEIQANLKNLMTEMSSTAVETVLVTHEKMEKRLSRKTKKKNLELPLEKARKTKGRSRADSANVAGDGRDADEDEEIDRPPEDSDDEDAAAKRAKGSDDELSSDDGDEADSSADEGDSAKDVKQKAALSAERSLCDFAAKIVLAILGQVMPKGSDIKARLQLNRTKLGKSYTQVIAFLDDKKEKAKSKSKGAAGPNTPMKKTNKVNGTTTKKAAPISEALVLSDDDIEDDEDDEQRAEDDPEALREKGLNDDPIDEVQDNDDEVVSVVEGEVDDDDVMGD